MAVETIRGELPEEGDEEEARQVVRRHPVRLPTYRLERVAISNLQVDYAAPYGDGYARPLSPGRLKQLRRDWDQLAVSPMTLSRRSDNSLWIIDGNHRRVVAFENNIAQLPAMVHSNLTREQEADLYTKLGTVLGQTPWTRFQAKLIAGNQIAIDIIKISLKYDFEVNATGHQDARIQAVARLEWIYNRGGPQALDWVLAFLASAFGGQRDSLGELQLEGCFGFYQRYNEKVQREEIARILGASGMEAWHNRADAIFTRVDVGRRSNTYGMAIAEMTNDVWRKKGKRVKDLLPAWATNLAWFPVYEAKFMEHSGATAGMDHSPAPQQLNLPAD